MPNSKEQPAGAAAAAGAALTRRRAQQEGSIGPPSSRGVGGGPNDTQGRCDGCRCRRGVRTPDPRLPQSTHVTTGGGRRLGPLFYASRKDRTAENRRGQAQQACSRISIWRCRGCPVRAPGGFDVQVGAVVLPAVGREPERGTAGARGYSRSATMKTLDAEDGTAGER